MDEIFMRGMISDLVYYLKQSKASKAMLLNSAIQTIYMNRIHIAKIKFMWDYRNKRALKEKSAYKEATKAYFNYIAAQIND